MSLLELGPEADSAVLELLAMLDAHLREEAAGPREALRRALELVATECAAARVALAIRDPSGSRVRIEAAGPGEAPELDRRAMQCARGERSRIWEDDRADIRGCVSIAAAPGEPAGALGLQLSAARAPSPERGLALLTICAGLIRPAVLRWLAMEAAVPARADEPGPPPLRTWIACSPRSQEVRGWMRQLAGARMPVIVSGEAGSGKTLIARLLAASGWTARGPCIVIACDELTSAQRERGPRGWLEQARDGTLVLDRAPSLDSELQAALAQALASTTAVRVIAIAGEPDSEAKSDARFRPELYHRLNGFSLPVPPLRERRADLPGLIEQHLARCDRGTAVVTPAAFECLAAHDWPGNVRELESVLGRAALLAAGGAIEPRMLPPALRSSDSVAPEEATLRVKLDAFERQAIVEALRAAEGRKARAARALHLTSRALAYRMRRLGL